MYIVSLILNNSQEKHGKYQNSPEGVVCIFPVCSDTKATETNTVCLRVVSYKFITRWKTHTLQEPSAPSVGLQTICINSVRFPLENHLKTPFLSTLFPFSPLKTGFDPLHAGQPSCLFSLHPLFFGGAFLFGAYLFVSKGMIYLISILVMTKYTTLNLRI